MEDDDEEDDDGESGSVSAAEDDDVTVESSEIPNVEAPRKRKSSPEAMKKKTKKSKK